MPGYIWLRDRKFGIFRLDYPGLSAPCLLIGGFYPLLRRDHALGFAAIVLFAWSAIYSWTLAMGINFVLALIYNDFSLGCWLRRNHDIAQIPPDKEKQLQVEVASRRAGTSNIWTRTPWVADKAAYLGALLALVIIAGLLASSGIRARLIETNDVVAEAHRSTGDLLFRWLSHLAH